MNRSKFAFLPALSLILISAPTYAEDTPAYKIARAAIEQLDDKSSKHFEIRENPLGKDFFDIAHIDSGLICTASANAEIKITIFRKNSEGVPVDVGCSVVTSIRSLTFYAYKPLQSSETSVGDNVNLQFKLSKTHMENRAGNFKITNPQPMDQELYRFSKAKLSELKTVSGTLAEEIIADDGLFDSVWIKERNGWYFKMRHTSAPPFADGAKQNWFLLWGKLEPELEKTDRETIKNGLIK